jgi:hypothetical protein
MRDILRDASDMAAVSLGLKKWNFSAEIGRKLG